MRGAAIAATTLRTFGGGGGGGGSAFLGTSFSNETSTIFSSGATLVAANATRALPAPAYTTAAMMVEAANSSSSVWPQTNR